MKQLTKTGENFIRTICSGDSNSLISGKYDYKLPFSNVPEGTIFTANALDHTGSLITTNQQLGEALINWYNTYAVINNVDANLLAAQGFVESGYRLWHYDKFRSGSGISNIFSKLVYSHMVLADKPSNLQAAETDRLNPDELDKIIEGLVEPKLKLSYNYRGNNTNAESIAVAINNRGQLHQNIINYPQYSIKTQSAIMREILIRNNFLIANALFAYSRDISLVADKYILILDIVGRRYGEDFVREGIKYVNRIFGILGDKDNNKQPNVIYKKPKGAWFGYDIKFEVDTYKSFLG